MFCLSNKDEFQCKSDECIKWSYVCDGISHCSNKADEDCDMCTNDLYLCKDSSRINCTLACSTLGYIPCKNYVDKKICASVNKKSSSSSLLKNSIFRNDYSSEDGSILKNLFLNDKFLFSILGIFVFVSFLILLISFGVLYNRNKKKKRALPNHIENLNQQNLTNQDQNEQNLMNNKKILNLNSLSTSTTLSNNSLCFSDNKNMLQDGKKVNLLIQNDPPPNQTLTKSNDYLYKTENNGNNLVVAESNFEVIDYGEPPPSYKLSKYYPKADAEIDKKLNKNNSPIEPLIRKKSIDEDDNTGHIYENIDEINSQNESLESDSPKSRNKNQTRVSKRAKFQALKKHSFNTSSKLLNKNKSIESDSGLDKTNYNNNNNKNSNQNQIIHSNIQSTSEQFL